MVTRDWLRFGTARCAIATVVVLLCFLSWANDVAGDVLVSSRFTNNVLRYDDDGNFVGVFAQGNELLNPNGIAYGPDGHLYVGLGDLGKVLKYDGTAGTFLGEFVPAGSGGLGGVRDIVFGPDGHLYVASGTTDEVLQYNGSTGNFMGVAASGNGMDGPVGLAFGPQGRLYIGAALSNLVFVFDQGQFVQSFNAGPSHQNAVGLAFNSNGQLLVAQSVSNEVLAFDPVTGAFQGVFINGPTGIPIYMAVSADQELYVGAFQTGSVWRYNANTGALIDQFVTSGSGGLSGTHDVAFMPEVEQIVTVDSINVITGIYDSGVLSDMDESDDTRLCYLRGNAFSPLFPEIWLDVDGTLPTDNPSSLAVVLESQVNDFGIDQKIEVYNYQTSQYELVDTSDSSRNADSIVEVQLAGDVSRFVEAGTGHVRTRITYKSDGSGFLLLWKACIDQFVWKVVE